MRLHHTTGENGLKGILADRFIVPKPRRLSDGTEIQAVWLSDQYDGWMRTTAFVGAEATTTRITVELPDDEVVSWEKWKVKLSLPAQDALENAAYRWKLGQPSTWQVIERPISSREWIQIVRIADEASRPDRYNDGDTSRRSEALGPSTSGQPTFGNGGNAKR